MNETIDQLIQARFDRVADPTDGRDWSDILARAGSVEVVRRRPRPARVLVAAAAVLALASTAVAFGWPGAVIDFFNAPPAPESVAQFFETFNQAVPRGGPKNATVGEAREVMTAMFDANSFTGTHQTEHTLYVAPRSDGGFCFIWTDAGGGCADPFDPSAGPSGPGGRFGASWYEGDYATATDGYVRNPVHTVEARFADGTSVALPITWVSAPIDAGFFVYAVPPEHLTTSNALATVVALDANGDATDTQFVGVANPLDRDVPQTLPDGTKISLPRRAQAAEAREAFSFRTTSGDRAYLWVMPRTGGGTCYVYGTGAGGGFGCPSPHQLSLEPAINGDEHAGGVYFAHVKPEVAIVELRYASGQTERVTPVDGFVLHEMPAAPHLATVVALSDTGKAIFTQNEKGP